MQNGTYRTPLGSIVTIDGKHSGIVTIDFDWFEESACIDAEPEVDRDTQELRWVCASGCGCDNRAPLELIP